MGGKKMKQYEAPLMQKETVMAIHSYEIGILFRTHTEKKIKKNFQHGGKGGF